jgi:hypothetical protein
MVPPSQAVAHADAHWRQRRKVFFADDEAGNCAAAVAFDHHDRVCQIAHCGFELVAVALLKHADDMNPCR